MAIILDVPGFKRTMEANLTSELRKSARKAWLTQKPGVDKSTILDILVYTEVRGISADISMAEALENVVLFNAKPPDKLEWYEQDYLSFLRKWADERKKVAQEVLGKLEERRE